MNPQKLNKRVEASEEMLRFLAIEANSVSVARNQFILQYLLKVINNHYEINKELIIIIINKIINLIYIL